MALLWWDSFDYVDTSHLVGLYTSVERSNVVEGIIGSCVISQGTGRCGTNSLHLIETPATIGVVQGLTPGDNTLIFGVAFKRIPGSNALELFRLIKNNTSALRCFADNTGAFTFITDQGALASEAYGTDGGLFQNNVYNFIEMKIVMDNTSGSIEIRRDGGSTAVWSKTGFETFADAAGAPPYTGFLLGGTNFSSGAEVYYDDLYILDGTGTRLNDFLGDVRVERLRPVSAGGRQMWILASGSSHWSAVDDDDMPDDATTRIESETVGDIDTNVYSDSSLPTGGIVHAVGMKFLASKDQPGNRTIAAVTRQGSTDYVSSTDLTITQDSYTYSRDVFETNPATSAPWTITEVNNAEFGEKVTN